MRALRIIVLSLLDKKEKPSPTILQNHRLFPRNSWFGVWSPHLQTMGIKFRSYKLGYY